MVRGEGFLQNRAFEGGVEEMDHELQDPLSGLVPLNLPTVHVAPTTSPSVVLAP